MVTTSESVEQYKLEANVTLSPVDRHEGGGEEPVYGTVLSVGQYLGVGNSSCRGALPVV